LHHILTTRMEPWASLSHQHYTQKLHMEHSLCLSFYLRCRLRGYTVGTTMGFSAKIVEALAPQSRCRISWKCRLYHMRTCSTHHRETGSGHLLNEGLRGYYRGRYPGYRGPPVMAQTSGYDRFPPAANGWGIIHPVPGNGLTTSG
jgi:hypothetical protein